MATIRTGLELYDRMSGVLGGIIHSLNLTISAMEDMQATTERAFNPTAIQAVREATRQTEAALRALPPPIADAEEEQRRLNKALADSESLAGGLLGHVTKIGAAIGAAMGVQKVVELSDTMTNLTARLDMLNDGMQSTVELQQKIFAAAQRSRTAYLSLADSVATLGAQAAHAFANTDELILFQELLGKTFTIAGTPAAGVQSAMYQLTQAMTSGVLRGEELNAVMENAMPIIQAIADYLDVPVGKIRSLAAEGKITSDIVKNALFAAADDINARFESMPMTWGAVWTSMKNQALVSLQPALQRLNELVNSDRFLQMAERAVGAFTTLAGVATTAFELAVGIFEFVSDNWPVIEPIIWGIVGAMTAYLAATQGVTLATKAVAAAQALWNAVLNMNPIVRIVTLIAGLIAALVRLWQTNDAFAAGLYRVWNGILGYFDQIPIFFLRVGLGVINAFQNMKVKALEIMDTLINGVISGINWLIEKLNTIPGVSIQALQAVDFSSRAAAEAEAIRQAGERAIAAMEAWAAERAAEREQRVLDFLDNRAARRAEQEAERLLPWAFDWNIGTIGRVEEVGRIRDTVDISAEDLRVLRELAEIRQNQYFVTLQPQFTYTHNGDIRNEQDKNAIIRAVEEFMAEGLASSARAVYGV
ncbi:tape measure protein [Symbiobacterium terraclitae]|uniref:tape measure protein n=1 Tax=Symbiobacterium terraclitae TaxID=557451 RepID=UPI0035B533F4